MNEQIRHAASVVAVREGTAEAEVLVVERGPSSRFLASYVVFPGGAVDGDDAELAGRWFGDVAEAARAAAVRELVEEAGLAITANGLVGAAGLVDAADRGSLDRVHAAPPTSDQLSDLCHWVAPERVPVRFDAHYYAVRAPADLEPTPDGAEAVAAWWASPRTLLAEWERGERKLYWPTWYTMTRLVECHHADELMAFRFDAREPDDAELERLPRSVFWEG